MKLSLIGEDLDSCLGSSGTRVKPAASVVLPGDHGRCCRGHVPLHLISAETQAHQRVVETGRRGVHRMLMARHRYGSGAKLLSRQAPTLQLRVGLGRCRYITGVQPSAGCKQHLHAVRHLGCSSCCFSALEGPWEPQEGGDVCS